MEEIVAVLKPFQKPDMLAEDRTNRQIDADLAMRMMKASKGFRGGLIESAAASDAISADVNTELAEKEEVVQEVLEAEAGFTTVAIMNEIKYVSKFKIHAAEIMLNVLVKIHREVVIAIMRSQTKVYFRCVVVKIKYSYFNSFTSLAADNCAYFSHLSTSQEPTDSHAVQAQHLDAKPQENSQLAAHLQAPAVTGPSRPVLP